MLSLKPLPRFSRSGLPPRRFFGQSGLRQLLTGILLAFSLLTGMQATASEAAPLAADPVAEKRLQAIAAELRCLVCQNETIAASNADLAVDLRREIRSMIQAGESDQQIIDFMVSRYGDFVLYRPPLKGTTFLLWFGPFLFAGIGLFALIRYLKRRNTLLATHAPLSEEEQRRADALLDNSPRKTP